MFLADSNKCQTSYGSERVHTVCIKVEEIQKYRVGLYPIIRMMNTKKIMFR
jgi:hypothetical protein